jgi:hypothetical protein
LFLRIIALLESLIPNFALHILVHMPHTNLLVGMNPDPPCCVLKGPVKVGDEHMWALDLKLFGEVIEALKGSDIRFFVLLAEAKSDIKGHTDIRDTAYIKKRQLEGVGFVCVVDYHDLGILLPHTLTPREGPEECSDVPLLLAIEMLDTALFEGANQRLSRCIACKGLVACLHDLVAYISLRPSLLRILRAHERRDIAS